MKWSTKQTNTSVSGEAIIMVLFYHMVNVIKKPIISFFMFSIVVESWHGSKFMHVFRFPSSASPRYTGTLNRE